MKNKVKNKKNISIFAIILFVILILYTASLLICVYWSFLTSLKSRSDFRYHNMFQLPREWMWKNFKNVFSVISVTIHDGNQIRKIGLGEMFFNSLWIPLVLTIFPMLVRITSAYVLAKYKFKGNELVYTVVFFAMIIPISNTMPAMLKMLRMLNIDKTLFSVVAMKTNLLDVSFLLFYATFKSLSWDYAEAAIIDGASHAKIMFEIMIPLVMPTVSVIFLTTFISYWNDYSTNLVWLPNHPMVSYGLYQYYTYPQQKFSIPLQLAASVLITLPTLGLFVLFKDKLMGNMTLGGLKG